MCAFFSSLFLSILEKGGFLKGRDETEGDKRKVCERRRMEIRRKNRALALRQKKIKIEDEAKKDVFLIPSSLIFSRVGEIIANFWGFHRLSTPFGEQPVAKKIVTATGANDYNLLQNNGRGAHQMVDHVRLPSPLPYIFSPTPSAFFFKWSFEYWERKNFPSYIRINRTEPLTFFIII